MKLAFYGSSLLSSYWNGAATYYRGLIKNLADLGWQITFYEPDAFDRQRNRDLDPPPWARCVVYPATPMGLARAAAKAAEADVVVKASGVGVFDTELLDLLPGAARPDAVRVFWDVDAPATLAEMAAADSHPVRRALPGLDMVLTYGGGTPVLDAYRGFGARAAWTVYNGLDPETHFPVEHERRFHADLALLANRLPDREARIEEFFAGPAAALPQKEFVLGGSGWDDKPMPSNVRKLGHVYVTDHNALNGSATAVLNVARDSMASVGFSPATRVFEAAGAGACIITDAWEGIELFFAPGREILVARDGRDVVCHLSALTSDQARRMGRAARDRALSEHTYARRAAEVDRILRKAVACRRERSA